MDRVNGIWSDEIGGVGYRAFVSSSPDPLLDSIVRAATAICHAPIAMVALFDDETEWLIARRGVDTQSLPRGHGFGDHTVRCAGGRCVVRDAAKDARFARLPLVMEAPHVRSFAAATILAGGRPIGTLAVAHQRAGRFDESQVGSLELLGRLAAMRLEHRRVAALVGAEDEDLPGAVTALVGEHERFRIFLESTGAGIVSFDLEGICTFANPTARTLLGYHNGGGLEGKAIPPLIKRSDGSPYEDGHSPILNAVIARRHAHLPSQRLAAADGSSLPVECWIAPVVVRNRLTGGALAFVDVSRQHRAEVAARRAIERRDRLMAIVAHDLRNPLQAIKLVTALPPLRANSRVSRIVVKAVSRMERMIGLLLDYTRAHSGTGLSVQPRHADLAAILSDAVIELRAANPGRQLLLHVEGDLSGEWDADRLAQIVTNLVNNAVKFGDPEREITCLAHADDDRVVLAVHNYGEAIPESEQPRVFDPFRRGRGRDRDTDGLGLGLYVVRAIAQAHGGQVRVHSTQGEGTTFMVTLPRHAALAHVDRPQ
jgi:PAS domain S-box-containing protein